LLLGAGAARAQDLEPRAYVDTPVDMNFLIASYAIQKAVYRPIHRYPSKAPN